NWLCSPLYLYTPYSTTIRPRGRDPVGECGRLVSARYHGERARGLASARAPTPDGDAEREHGGDSHTPAQGGTNHDDLTLTRRPQDRKSTRLHSSHVATSYAV